MALISNTAWSVVCAARASGRNEDGDGGEGEEELQGDDITPHSAAPPQASWVPQVPGDTECEEKDVAVLQICRRVSGRLAGCLLLCPSPGNRSGK
ncbi:hypothetical protein AOLI_G00103480 [Acnodon oligacanthus]